jgi:hypothetical protein
MDSSRLDLRYSLPISALGLSIRTITALRNDNIEFVGQLTERSEKSLLRLDGFGRKALTDVKEAIGSRGLSLGSVIVGRPDNYNEFRSLLATNARKALEEDIKGGALTAEVARDFKQAAILADIIERLPDPRFKSELRALVKKFDSHEPSGAR